MYVYVLLKKNIKIKIYFPNFRIFESYMWVVQEVMIYIDAETIILLH